MIRTLIKVSSPDCFRAISSSVSSYSKHKLNGMTLLHATVRVRENPPHDVVANIIKLCPEVLAAKDGLGRTRLHIAAGSQACPRLLKLKPIARTYPAACDVQDEGEKTPLHFICDTSFVLFASDVHLSSTPQHRKGPKHEAVFALLSASLSLNAAAIEDSDEMSPLEHAIIICEASLKTVKLLQSAARK